MLPSQPWMKGLSDISFELRQAEEEGRVLPPELCERAKALAGRPESDAQAILEAEAIYAEIQALPLRPGHPYREPDSLEEIQAERPEQPSLPACSLSDEELFDRIYGAWLGRCGGCLLGQPTEGWPSERTNGLLRDSNNYPVRSYISSALPEEIREKYGVSDEGGGYGAKKKGWINNVAYMPEDDDTNYTVLALKLLEDYGPDFTPADVAECWLMCLPLLHTCTAERMAYINLANLILPPASAVTNNPYREWIGAQIRGDLFGYIHPGDPAAAAAMAWRDASISHVKNGIYGEMYVAAMLASAFVLTETRDVVLAGLSQIPARSRLAESIRDILDRYDAGESQEQVVSHIRERWNESDGYDWCHTISNAMLVTVGLLYGGLDYAASVAAGIVYGFDTDCNAATIGSVVGLMLGAKRLPADWTAPLNDTLKSGVDGFGIVAISDLARRTAALRQ